MNEMGIIKNDRSGDFLNFPIVREFLPDSGHLTAIKMKVAHPSQIIFLSFLIKFLQERRPYHFDFLMAMVASLLIWWEKAPIVYPEFWIKGSADLKKRTAISRNLSRE